MGPSGLPARTMALAGTGLIAGLAVLLVLFTALPGGSGPSGTSSSLEPATPSELGGGPSCVAATGDLLCHEKETRSTLSGQSIHDPLISLEGPGTLSPDGPGVMIDGDLHTVWISAGDAKGATILLEFNEPVTVGTVGLTAGTDPAASSELKPGRRVIAADWSFARQDGSSGRPCGASGDVFGPGISQDLSMGETMKIPSAVTTCSVRMRIERVSPVQSGAAFSSDVGISELTLLAG